jgi:hypothetical protein
MTTTDTTATDTTTPAVVDTYFQMWNETDPARRAELVAQAWTDDGRHVDPLADVAGHEALSAYVAGVQERFPDHQLRRTSGVDVHHDQLRYAWELAGPDGTVVVSALDVAELGADGRIRQVAAFFGDLPAAG